MWGSGLVDCSGSPHMDNCIDNMLVLKTGVFVLGETIFGKITSMVRTFSIHRKLSIGLQFIMAAGLVLAV